MIGDLSMVGDIEQMSIAHAPADGDSLAGLLHLLAEIRAAVDDPHGSLMQDELVARCRDLSDARRRLQAENTRLRQARGELLQNSAALRKERDRLLVLATKYCDPSHHDWAEIRDIAGDA